MMIDTTRTLPAPAATPARGSDRKQVAAPDPLTADRKADAARRGVGTPQLRAARGGDSLEISAAGRRLLEESLRPHADPQAAARKARAEALQARPPAQEDKPPGEVPGLLVPTP